MAYENDDQEVHRNVDLIQDRTCPNTQITHQSQEPEQSHFINNTNE